MPSTPNFAIPYPDGATGLTPLQQKFADIANSVDTALTTGIGGAPRLAFSNAERNTIYPSPVQGNTVNRPDLGWIEQYFAAYNATTNPSGATPAGWYPTIGEMPNFNAFRGSFTAANGVNVAPLLSGSAVISHMTRGWSLSGAGAITPPSVGDYEVISVLSQETANSAGQRNVAVTSTGTVLGTASNNYTPQGGSITNTTYMGRFIVRITATGQTITPVIVQNTGGGLAVNFSSSIRFLGPSK